MISSRKKIPIASARSVNVNVMPSKGESKSGFTIEEEEDEAERW